MEADFDEITKKQQIVVWKFYNSEKLEYTRILYTIIESRCAMVTRLLKTARRMPREYQMHRKEACG